jgi:hypothetical protein
VRLRPPLQALALARKDAAARRISRHSHARQPTQASGAAGDASWVMRAHQSEGSVGAVVCAERVLQRCAEALGS